MLLGGPPNPLGTRVKMAEAHHRIFGIVLMNDWSARDIQKWEYQPLGPFGAKNFATTISPWVVSMHALEPFRIERSAMDDVLPYLKGVDCVYDVELQVALQNERGEESVVCDGNMKSLHWSFVQQIAHHSVTGCNLNPADLIASGTISGDERMFSAFLSFSCFSPSFPFQS